MAKFNEAYDKLIGYEGGYVDDPDDIGGQTYKGISRVYWPNWQGWIKIDNAILAYGVDTDSFSRALSRDIDLELLVKDFYRSNFWDINRLTSFSSQFIANELFEVGVNLGYKDAAMFLQLGLNILNKNEMIYKDIIVDGIIGPATLAAMTACIDYRGDSYLYKVLNLLQGNYYINRMSENKTQEKFAYGWLDRVDILKKN